MSILNSIRWKVYKCQNFKNRNGEIYRNNHSITLIFHTIYLNILNNDNKISEFRKADIINQKKYYYDQITRDIYDEKDSENIPVIMNELKKYTKILIDNQDKEVFKRTFIDKLEI
ncbi:hypothetical protein J2Z35_001096 [Acetoanaerobium pronyense]|uniref:Uncharacterized protein n=1 Tax=Acetoanaerobium pronyense TaxID=1482736 RepID=A0ABS4KHN3_9FIRM|nr:hypothetical protein [Acetoanaerobium pronyense]MBP2027302.1 hypothetical protein [Acetoanaerobium pronyense]